MKKIIITYLASLILFQGAFMNTDIVFEINEILLDYQLHKTKYGDNTYTFLSKHFGDLKESHKEEHQKEHEEHKHPIQDQLVNTPQVDYTFHKFQFIPKNETEQTSKSTNFHYKDIFSSFEKQKIFQPPRIA